MEILFGILLGAFLILCIAFFLFRQSPKETLRVKEVLMENEKHQQEALFQMQQSMQQQMQRLQLSMQRELAQWKEATSEHLYVMEKHVNTTVQHGYENTSKVFSQVMEQMGKLDEGLRNLKELSLSINDIQRVLTDKKTRGIFGEIELYSLLETAMGVNTSRYAKQYKLSNGAIADAVLFGKEPLHMICIDSKFPLENYNRIMAAQTKEEQQKYHTIFVNDVKKHIKAIAQKYILPQETADFAYLFLPAEAVFAYLYAQCDEVVNYSYQEKVYMVSPTTLMAYITAIKAIYLGVERNENLAQMQKELQKLEMEFERFAKRYQNVQSDFDKCYQDMRLLSITANKLHMRFQEIQAVELTKKDTA